MSLNSNVTYVLDSYTAQFAVPYGDNPVLLDKPGGLRNSRTIHTIAQRSGVISRRGWLSKRGSPSARPKPRACLRCSAALMGPNNWRSG
jgi:hypothetical protein